MGEWEPMMQLVLAFLMIVFVIGYEAAPAPIQPLLALGLVGISLLWYLYWMRRVFIL